MNLYIEFTALFQNALHKIRLYGRLTAHNYNGLYVTMLIEKLKNSILILFRSRLI